MKEKRIERGAGEVPEGEQGKGRWKNKFKVGLKLGGVRGLFVGETRESKEAQQRKIEDKVVKYWEFRRMKEEGNITPEERWHVDSNIRRIFCSLPWDQREEILERGRTAKKMEGLYSTDNGGDGEIATTSKNGLVNYESYNGNYDPDDAVKAAIYNSLSPERGLNQASTSSSAYRERLIEDDSDSDEGGAFGGGKGDKIWEALQEGRKKRRLRQLEQEQVKVTGRA